jgi:hypothetical protein
MQPFRQFFVKSDIHKTNQYEWKKYGHLWGRRIYRMPSRKYFEEKGYQVIPVGRRELTLGTDLWQNAWRG